MKRGARFSDDQAEIVFSDLVVEQLDELGEAARIDVLAEIVRLCAEPAGKHPLSHKLAGWNTLDVLAGHKRVVYKASTIHGVGLVEALCLGPRTDSEVYDMAAALALSGVLSPEEVTQLWDALGLLQVIAEDVGLDGWDYRPDPAPDGMVRAVVAAGLLTEAVARLLSKDELEAAMSKGWGAQGADPDAALRAALERARSSVNFPGRSVIDRRAEDRCGVLMPRAQVRCIRRRGHPGPHRARW